MNLVCIGNIAYWVEAVDNERLTININHTFQKQSDLSQFEIVGPNGRLKMSVPTVKSTRKGPYKKVQIDYSSPWQVEHWRSLENAYRKSPFWQHYDYKIEPVFKARYTNLFAFNKALFEVVLGALKIKPRIDWDDEKPCKFVSMEAARNEEYPQVFDAKLSFEPNLCVLDLLFNLGPEAIDYLKAQ